MKRCLPVGKDYGDRGYITEEGDSKVGFNRYSYFNILEEKVSQRENKYKIAGILL